MKNIWKKIKDVLCNNAAIKCSSVLLAIVSWLLVINIDDPQITTTITNVPVIIVNENAITDQEQVYDIISGDTVDIKVTGPRTIVDSLTKSDFTATANFADMSKTSAVPIDVSLNNSRYESKVTITSKSENAMRLTVRDLIEKEYDVMVVQGGSPETGYVVYDTVPEKSKVTVKAPDSVHKSISKVAVIISLDGTESENFKSSGALVAYDTGNNIMDTKLNHITISQLNMSVDATVYYKSTVDISYEVTDNTGADIILTGSSPSVNHVDIVGMKEDVLAISSIHIPDSMVVFNNEVQEVNIDLSKLLPEGVYIHEMSEFVTIKAQVENTQRKTVEFLPEDIGIKKIPQGYETTINERGVLSVTLSGRQSELDELDAGKLAPYVDLSGAVEGSNRVRVSLVLPDGITELSELYVEIVLTGKEDDETTGDTTEPTTEGSVEVNTEPVKETDTTETPTSHEEEPTPTSHEETSSEQERALEP